jgi:hypothetical protein
MIAFGLFVLLTVGVIAGFAIVASDDPAVVNLLGFDFETTERWQFATGALCALSAVIAFRIIMIGWRRARRRQRELHELREAVSQQTMPISERRDDRDHRSAQPEHRSAQHDSRSAKHNSQTAQSDSRWAQHDWRLAESDWRSAQPERDGLGERDHFDSTPHD